MTVYEQRKANQEKFIYASNIPTFDVTKPLPPTVLPSTKWQYNFKVSLYGLGGVRQILAAPNLKSGGTELNTISYLTPNLTRLRPDKFSDEFFVERRLNGFSPGKLKRVENQPWQYAIRYDFSGVSVDANGILPQFIEARFCLDGQQLHVHSIEFILHGETEIQNLTPRDQNWEWAKKLFRSAEFVLHETVAHLGSTHLNIDQYAMAYYRNVVNNPIIELLEPHFEGLLSINQQGLSELVGSEAKEGVVPQLTALNFQDTQKILVEALKTLTYRNWSPRSHTLPDYVANNHYDRAAIAFWQIINKYVKDFFDQNQAGIQQYWSEIEAMSKDLAAHSILKPELGTLDIKTLQDLRQMCVYVIYISTFQHSWVNHKQYDDGGDIEYATLGMWKENDAMTAARNGRQLSTTLNLTSVRHNPIMGVDHPVANKLKEALWENRKEIEPGIAIDTILMSISI
ncbi:MAG: lipoxygenase family protein [Nostoc sp.]|uniref:lipoxygenase family protein n=1 Tax=Nostoc sp. TaxID=1180 RepID=UPI002FF45962